MTTLLASDINPPNNMLKKRIKNFANKNIKKGWEAELHLGFTQKGTKTLLSHRSHKGPLIVQRPFYPEGGMCHVYLLHPPGGVVAGDSLLIDVHAASNTEVLITTPAAGKFYRSAGDKALQNVNLQVDEDAVLEWVPQETIIYEGARLASKVIINLEKQARFIGWEILALGRPASSEGFESGEVHLSWQILQNKKLIYLERMRLDAQAFAARWGLNKQSVCGTLFAIPATTKQLEKIRTLMGDTPNQGVTLIDDLLICRASNEKTEPVRNFFESVRAVIRADIVQREIHTPRIWAT